MSKKNLLSIFEKKSVVTRPTLKLTHRKETNSLENKVELRVRAESEQEGNGIAG